MQKTAPYDMTARLSACQLSSQAGVTLAVDFSSAVLHVHRNTGGRSTSMYASTSSPVLTVVFCDLAL